jgi:hypothetical protein
MVVGDSQHLSLYIGKVPDYKQNQKNQNLPPQNWNDLRRVCYWVAQDGGLARQEIQIPTAQDIVNQTTPWGAGDENQYIIAPKVTEVTFEYYDGSTWNDSWQMNGIQFQADNKTPVGPPMAIRVTLTVKGGAGNDSSQTKTYQHVIAIPTADGLPNNSGSTNSSMGSSSSSSSSGSSSSGN